MINDILLRNEGKTLEFKENLNSPAKIIKTAIALANTAGGMIVVGIEDKTKNLVGVANVLQEEERITSLLTDSIAPMLMPDIDIMSHLGKELLVINIPHLAGPYHLKKAGAVAGTYIRVGSSNRLADPDTLSNLQRYAKRVSFDEIPCVSASVNELDEYLIQEKLKYAFKNISKKNYESLGITGQYAKKQYATHGGLLLFAKDLSKWLPDAMIKCVAFASTTKQGILDRRQISVNMINAAEEAINFIQRNTRVPARIGKIIREDIPEYPEAAIREAVINAIVHADYSIKGSTIQIAIYRDRIEITNPGGLTWGQTMRSALSGVSKMRNPVVGRVFREIGLIETLGMGIQNIFHAYEETGVQMPEFIEQDHVFKVTLYSTILTKMIDEPWVNELHGFLVAKKKATTSDIAEMWGVTVRTASTRLSKLMEFNYIQRNAKSKHDPTASYSLRSSV